MTPADHVGHLDLLARTLADIAATDPSRHGHTGPDTPEITARYATRNRLIWAALALAHETGVPAGVGYDPTDPGRSSSTSSCPASGRSPGTCRPTRSSGTATPPPSSTSGSTPTPPASRRRR